MTLSDASLAKVDDILACPVCIEPNDKASVATNCRHLYHKPCIDKILALEVEKRLCPMCSTPLETMVDIPVAMIELAEHVKSKAKDAKKDAKEEKVEVVAMEQIRQPAPEFVPDRFECPPKPNLSLLALSPKEQEEVDRLFFQRLIDGNRRELVEALSSKSFLPFLRQLSEAKFQQIEALVERGNTKEAIERFFIEYRPADLQGWSQLFYLLEVEFECKIFTRKLLAIGEPLREKLVTLEFEAFLAHCSQLQVDVDLRSLERNQAIDLVLNGVITAKNGWIVFLQALNRCKELADIRIFFVGTPQQYCLNDIMKFREVFRLENLKIVQALRSINFPVFLALLRSIEHMEGPLNVVKAEWLLGREMDAVVGFLNQFHARWDWHELLEAFAQFTELLPVRKLFGSPQPIKKALTKEQQEVLYREKFISHYPKLLEKLQTIDFVRFLERFASLSSYIGMQSVKSLLQTGKSVQAIELFLTTFSRSWPWNEFFLALDHFPELVPIRALFSPIP